MYAYTHTYIRIKLKSLHILSTGKKLYYIENIVLRNRILFLKFYKTNTHFVT